MSLGAGLLGERAGQMVVIYDAGCGLCTRAAQFAARRDRSGRMGLLGSETSRARALASQHCVDLATLDSLVVIAGHQAFTGAGAAARMAAEMRWPWSLLRFVAYLPAWLREPPYRFIAGSRGRLFRGRECPLPEVVIRDRFLS